MTKLIEIYIQLIDLPYFPEIIRGGLFQPLLFLFFKFSEKKVLIILILLKLFGKSNYMYLPVSPWPIVHKKFDYFR